jgi:hypothetical protein
MSGQEPELRSGMSCILFLISLDFASLELGARFDKTAEPNQMLPRLG